MTCLDSFADRSASARSSPSGNGRRYTRSEECLIEKFREDGYSWRAVTEAFNKQYPSRQRSEEALAMHYRRKQRLIPRAENSGGDKASDVNGTGTGPGHPVSATEELGLDALLEWLTDGDQSLSVTDVVESQIRELKDG